MDPHISQLNAEIAPQEEDLMNFWQDATDQPSNLTIDSTHFQADSLLVTFDSHQKKHHKQEDPQRPKTSVQIGQSEVLQEAEYTSQGQQQAIKYWTKWGDDRRDWKIDQIKEVSDENTSLRQTEIKQSTQSERPLKQYEFEVNEGPIEQFSQKLQQRKHTIQECQTQIQQKKIEKQKQETSINGEAENLAVSAETGSLQGPNNDQRFIQVQQPVIQPVLIQKQTTKTTEGLTEQNFNQQIQLFKAKDNSQYFQRQIISQASEQPKDQRQEIHQIREYKEDLIEVEKAIVTIEQKKPETQTNVNVQKIVQNEQVPMQIEFNGLESCHKQELIQASCDNHKNTTAEQPMEIENLPVQQTNNPSICKQRQSIIFQDNSHLQTHNKNKQLFAKFIQPILLLEAQPPMNESMIASNLFTFGKTHPQEKVNERSKLLDELPQTQSVNYPDQKIKEQTHVVNIVEQKQKKYSEVQSNLQTDTAHVLVQKILEAPNIQPTRVQLIELTSQHLQNVLIKKQISTNQVQISQKNQVVDIISMASCKFYQNEVIQNNKHQQKITLQNKSSKVSQNSQIQVISKIEAANLHSSRIPQQGWLQLCPIRDDCDQIAVHQTQQEQISKNRPQFSQQVLKEHPAAPKKLNFSKVLQVLVPVSTQNHSSLIQPQPNVSQSIKEPVQPIQNVENQLQVQFKVQQAAHQYLMKALLSEQDHKRFQQILSPYLQLKFLIEPLNDIGSHLCQNGLILIAVTYLVTRDSKTDWLMQYIYEYYSKTFKIGKYQEVFINQMNKAKQRFIKSLEKVLIENQSPQEVKQKQKQVKDRPIIRTYQTTSFISINTDKINHQQQTSNKRLVLDSHSMSINQKLGPYKQKYPKVSQGTETSPPLKIIPTQFNRLQPKASIQEVQQLKKIQTVEERPVSPINRSKYSTITSSAAREGERLEDAAAKLSQRLIKEEEAKLASKKRQISTPIYNDDHKKDSNKIRMQFNNVQDPKVNYLVQKYRKIRENRQSKSNETNRPIMGQQNYILDQKIGESIEHVAKRVQFAQDLKDEENCRDEDESHLKKKRQRKSKAKKDSSFEESDYEQHNAKEKLRKRTSKK